MRWRIRTPHEMGHARSGLIGYWTYHALLAALSLREPLTGLVRSCPPSWKRSCNGQEPKRGETWDSDWIPLTKLLWFFAPRQSTVIQLCALLGQQRSKRLRSQSMAFFFRNLSELASYRDYREALFVLGGKGVLPELSKRTTKWDGVVAMGKNGKAWTCFPPYYLLLFSLRLLVRQNKIRYRLSQPIIMMMGHPVK